MGDSFNCESSARQRAGSKLKSVGQKVTEATRETVSEFLQSSSLLGSQYIGTRPLKEKICWVVVVIASMTCCCYQIQEVYQQWREGPIIIAYDQKLQSVTDIPFPAVTVCLPLVINGTSFDFLNLLLNLNNSDELPTKQILAKVFNMVSSSCLYKTRRDYELMSPIGFYLDRFTNFDMKITSSNSPLFKIIESDLNKVVFKNCRGVFSESFTRNCDVYFERIDTPEGACFSFNFLNRDSLLKNNTVMGFGDRIARRQKPKYWSLEDGYDDDGYVDDEYDDDRFEYPYKAFEYERGFEFELKFEPSDSQFKCFDKPHLYIHHPHDLPWSESNKIDLSDGYKLKISVTPEITLTDASLRTSSSPEQRQCYFDDEVQLRYFKIYSESNCRLECLSNITRKRNNCVAFWMPRDKGMKVCGASEAHRSVRADTFLDLKTLVVSENICFPCLPRCNSITYTNMIADLSKVKDETVMESRNKIMGKILYSPNMLKHEFFDFERALLNETNATKADDPSLDRKRLEIVFAKPHVLAFKRSPLYQSFDFISTIGGLLGVFIGMSLLSLVEVLYFLTVRLIEKCRRRRSTDGV